MSANVLEYINFLRRQMDEKVTTTWPWSIDHMYMALRYFRKKVEWTKEEIGGDANINNIIDEGDTGLICLQRALFPSLLKVAEESYKLVKQTEGEAIQPLLQAINGLEMVMNDVRSTAPYAKP